MKYYVVEFRFPYQSKSEDLDEAVEDAIVNFEQTFGVRPEKWNARVFEYGGEEQVGPIEYFYNPAGTLIFVKDKNE